LAVEILSPSTRYRDLGLKRRAYEDAGLPWYWIVDPKKPRLTVLRLIDGRFVEHAVVTGDEEYVTTEPVAVTVVPSALVS
jgi:Uma2 family endonuclease